jgi:hypothetical protein
MRKKMSATTLSAVVSLLALVLFWNGLIFLFPHKIGNIAVNAAVLGVIPIMHWPLDSAFGY